jgi:hypothetical protein
LIHRPNALIAASAVLVLAAAARIISTYQVFSQTSDEPAHLATGMEWLQKGTYALEPLHPPLARIAAALGPYLSGIRLPDQPDVWGSGNALFFARGNYLRTLFLARLGVLPFFLIAAFLVFYWARTRYGDASAFFAVLLFTTSPVVLAHSGLATTDMAAAAAVIGTLAAWIAWMEKPGYRSSVILGAAAGLATLCKFSVPLFLAAAIVSLLLWRWWFERSKTKALPRLPFIRTRQLAFACAIACFVLWAGYRFSLGSLTATLKPPYAKLDRFVGRSGTAHNLAYAVVESSWIPAPQFFQGLRDVRLKESMGHTGYLLGQIRDSGWWYFFPVALLVKTPIPFLIFIGLGLFYLRQRARDWIAFAPAIAAAAILLVCIPSRINIGIRHILPIYPLLAILAGVGAAGLWNTARFARAAKASVLLLLMWQAVISWRSQPDFLAYFNEFAGSHPEKILIDSDLDWGQDLLRLSAALGQRHIPAISIAYAGSAKLDLGRFGLPPFHVLAPHEQATGWIAISMLRLKVGGLGLPEDSFRWLSHYSPAALIGHSIYLYYVPPAPPGQALPADAYVVSKK